MTSALQEFRILEFIYIYSIYELKSDYLNLKENRSLEGRKHRVSL